MSNERAEGNFRVRKATPEDRDVLQLIIDGSIGTTGTKIHGMGPDELLRHNSVYIAFLEERPIGCVMATLAIPMVLHCLHVVPEVRTVGHAGALLTLAIKDMDETAPAEFWTAVDPARRSGVERCLSLGFEELNVDFTELSAPLSGMCVMIRGRPEGLKGHDVTSPGTDSRDRPKLFGHGDVPAGN